MNPVVGALNKAIRDPSFCSKDDFANLVGGGDLRLKYVKNWRKLCDDVVKLLDSIPPAEKAVKDLKKKCKDIEVDLPTGKPDWPRIEEDEVRRALIETRGILDRIHEGISTGQFPEKGQVSEECNVL